VQTRLSKLDNGEYAALILAQAGLNRLSLQHRIHHGFTVDEMIPSGSQGILAVQGRQGEEYGYLSEFHSKESETVSKGERQYLSTLGSSCTSPVAIYGEIHGNEIMLSGMYVDASGETHTGKINGPAEKAESLGDTLAKRLLARAENKY
jgi:hydroxymethylbilane synthase